MEKIHFWPLDKVIKIVETIGLEVTYAFEDLVFADHSTCIIRFDKENESDLHVYINAECDEKVALQIKQGLFEASRAEKLTIKDVGQFLLNQTKDKEELQIEFF